MPLPKRPAGYEALQTYANRLLNRHQYRDLGTDDHLLRLMKAYYYACISFIDFQMGRMLNALERTGQLDNTLILYTSDHGDFLGDYNCFGKCSMLDAAARIPLLARYPERFPQGATCQRVTSLVDVMPTLLAAADVDRSAYTLAGQDLAEVAADTSGSIFGGRTIYSQYQHDKEGVYMACNERHKYFYSAPDRREFLFDRITDPDETRNRAGVSLCASTLAEMRDGLFAYYRDEGFTAPLDGDGWKLFPQPTLSADPDAELLVQDPPWSLPYQRIPGYTD
jgi:arylsulfatase A-like enzyme